MDDEIESDHFVTDERVVTLSSDRSSNAPLPGGSSAIEGPSGIGSKEKRRIPDDIEGDDSQEPSGRERKRPKSERYTESSIVTGAAMDACETHDIDQDADMLIMLLDANRPFAVRDEPAGAFLRPPNGEEVDMREPPRMVQYHVSTKHMPFASPSFQNELKGEQKGHQPTGFMCAHDSKALLI
ncbi:hypothetical protein BDW69DRAFT_185096 [Aspergillus filifer]